VVVPAGTSPADFSAAARVYWTLKVAGHRRLSILAGGFAGWAAAGRAVETGPDRGEAGPPYPVAIDPTLRATTDEVAAIVAGGGAALVDGRNRPRSRARRRPRRRSAPAAFPAPSTSTARRPTTPANSLRSPAELSGLFASVPPGPVVAYCNTGQAASTGWFVLSEILGREGVTLYDGSMTAWTQDEARPVETGSPSSFSR
jgi:thiosulfate/3-mercaptopyruvate sulfurtransferase